MNTRLILLHAYHLPVEVQQLEAREGEVDQAPAAAFEDLDLVLEIAAVFLTWELMGPEVAVARVVMAAVLALVVALFVARFAPPSRGMKRAR